jgi:hypothetical protein
MFALDSPSSSPINQKFSIYIRLLSELSEDVEIVVRADDCEIVGSNTRIVSTTSERRDERFVLIPHQPGEKQIRIDVYQSNNKSIYRQTTMIWIEGEAISKTNIIDRTQEVPLGIQVNNNTNLTGDYLELYVQQDRRNPCNLIFSLTSINSRSIDYYHKEIGQITLPSSPEEKMNSIYKRLDTLAANVTRKLAWIINEGMQKEENKKPETE